MWNQLLIVSQVRMRDTFMKAGYSLMQRKELGNEKNLKEHMIHSVMPPKVRGKQTHPPHVELT